jgi:Lysine methyltransferase
MAGITRSVIVEHENPAEQHKLQQPFLTIRNIPVYFQEDWGTGIGGGLWSTGLAMAKYLQTDHAWNELRRFSVPRKYINNKSDDKMTIVELGSGNGLLSMCWLALFAAINCTISSSSDDGGGGTNDDSCCCKNLELIVTDTLDHLPLIQKTLQANQHVLEKMPPSTSVRIMEHQWGAFEPRRKVLDKSTEVQEDAPFVHEHDKLSGSSTVDMIVGSDLAYREELYDPLIASLTKLSNEQTIILLGCTMADTTPEFFNRLWQAGLVYTRLADHLLDCNFRGQTFGIFVIQKRQTKPYCYS